MSNIRPLDRKPYYVDHYEHLHRILGRPQLTGTMVKSYNGWAAFQIRNVLEPKTECSPSGALALTLYIQALEFRDALV